MRILMIGSGGREHALLFGLSKSPKVEALFCAPGNAGTAALATNLPIDVTATEDLLNVAIEQEIDLTIVGPEVPLANGIVDAFEEAGQAIFGPNKADARLESSKQFTKDILVKHNIPTAKSEHFTDVSAALKALPSYGLPVVIKADGLCAGKGVIIARTEQEAVAAVREILAEGRFGDQGTSILVEQYLSGYEASVFCFASKGKLIPMKSAMDYKKIGVGDTGENTGGVGCIAPNPKLSDTANTRIYQEIVPAIEAALLKEGIRFTGLLFIGFLIENDIPYVLEFNTRFGDPETEALIPLLASDLAVIFEKAMDGTLSADDFSYHDGVCMGVVATAIGYPGAFEKGLALPPLHKLSDEIVVFHNGTAKKGENYTINGGRVLTFITLQNDLKTCREVLYNEIDSLELSGLQYRSDIGR